MRALVTGAATPLGRAVIDALVRDPDVERVVASAGANDPPPPPPVIFEPAALGHARDVHDLVWRATSRHHVDTVIHLGAPCDPSTDRRASAADVLATRRLVHHCAEHPTIRRFVYRSFAEVYALEHAASDLLDEDAALDFDPAAPAWLRDRVEADLAVLGHAGDGLSIAVLRLAEVLAADSGSQLWDYLSSRVCVRPLGFDPMLNVLSLDDAAAALVLAARSSATGVLNIPGADTLPLSRAITEAGRVQLALPGPVLGPLYGARRWATGFRFRYDLNLRRFHFGGLLDGGRARQRLGYVPRQPVRWPRAWWRVLIDRLATRAA
ncbi:MAG TPA: NAD-dependent epimerase/dehydratase family protein [Kofleriaceae bacterium]|nr:NAD-dependent epimerase/dehydratase family protein [Kofleriaceae bacterium]